MAKFLKINNSERSLNNKFDDFLAGLNEIVLVRVDLDYLAVELGFDYQLHLHSLHGQDWVALFDQVSCLLVDLCDYAWHGGFQQKIALAFSLDLFHLVRVKVDSNEVRIKVLDMNSIVIINEILNVACLSVDGDLNNVWRYRFKGNIEFLAFRNHEGMSFWSELQDDVLMGNFLETGLVDWDGNVLLFTFDVAEIEQFGW